VEKADNIFGSTKTIKTILDDGNLSYSLVEELKEFPLKITDKLIYWAEKTPEKTFLTRKNDAGKWIELSYEETLQKVKSISQYLINQDFKSGETIVILSENSLEHALLALAALYVGITYSPISPAYSLVSTDFGKLKHCLNLMTPKLIFAQDENVYKNALKVAKEMFPDAIISTLNSQKHTPFSDFCKAAPSKEVNLDNQKIKPESVAKVLFTSGSTGLPKGVINTHIMWCASLQQISQVFSFMQSEPPVFIDWLPWNHTFGGNHNFGLTLYNGGTLYIDEGKPSKSGIEITLKNLQEISPTAYFNVPKGLEMLLPYLEKDSNLREIFFKNLRFFFYAGASLAQPLWDKFQKLSLETTGKIVPIVTGLGCTEAGPSAMFSTGINGFSGLLGVPVAGMEVKLVADGDKLEARYKAPNVFPGYWRNEEATAAAFDEEGYYKTGDAVKFLDEQNPDAGLVFDGRIAEDFKLSTGTWVSVGVLKAKVLSAGSPIVQDVVIAGLDRDYVSVILFLNADACKVLVNEELENDAFHNHKLVHDFLKNAFEILNKNATGSSTRIEKYVIAIAPPNIDLGEITDKGSLNQRAVLKHRAELIDEMYE
jgi:feruloyl-CoA synthase